MISTYRHSTGYSTSFQSLINKFIVRRSSLLPLFFMRVGIGSAGGRIGSEICHRSIHRSNRNEYEAWKRELQTASTMFALTGVKEWSMLNHIFDNTGSWSKCVSTSTSPQDGFKQGLEKTSTCVTKV